MTSASGGAKGMGLLTTPSCLGQLKLGFGAFLYNDIPFSPNCFIKHRNGKCAISRRRLEMRRNPRQRRRFLFPGDGGESLKEDYTSCPHKDSCFVKERKRFNAVTIIDKKLIADRYRSLLGTVRHQMLAGFRAGVEGVPSVLRRVYRIDDLPVRGLVRTRIWDHFKIMACNFKSFYGYCKRNGASPLSLAYFFHLFRRCFGFGRALACYG